MTSEDESDGSLIATGIASGLLLVVAKTVYNELSGSSAGMPGQDYSNRSALVEISKLIMNPAGECPGIQNHNYCNKDI